MSQTPNDTILEDDISQHIPRIQDLFGRVLESYCGGGDVGITAICDRLGVHRKLAWQVRNVAYSPDPFRAVRFMPSRTSIQTLVKALLERGLEEELARALADAGEAFSELIETHAGDRGTLEMLVEACAPQAQEHADVKWREKAFLGNSFVWGVRAKTQLSACLFLPSSRRPGWFDYVQVRGLIAFKRVRPDVHWLVGQSVVRDGDTGDRQPERAPLDPDAAAQMNGVPILPEFCSRPTPKLRRRPIDGGLLNDEVLPGPVGFAGQQTIVTGEIVRDLSQVYTTSENRRAMFGAVVRTPSEVFVYDHFVHHSLFAGVDREVCVFSELNSPVAHSDEDVLPVSETIHHIGRGLGAARTPDVPGYIEMLRWVFERLDHNPDEFNVHRVRLEFPPMPTSVVIRHPLPAPAPPNQKSI